MDFIFAAIYVIPAVIIIAFYLWRQRRIEQKNLAVYTSAVKQGVTDPVSLHPRFNSSLCIGSGSCVSACPEQALGIINGRARLLDASRCIGHGACKAACPHGAIELVFGSERRGVDIPMVNTHFETNVPGLFIAGELGGMGLIKNACEQGKRAVEEIAKSLTSANYDFDLVIVGAGPAGLAAALTAKSKKLRYVVLEQESTFGGTIFHYPRNKMVMTSNVDLPIVGRIKFGYIDKERLLDIWTNIVEHTDLNIRFNETVTGVEPQRGGFVIKTNHQQLHTQRVLLAIGRRGTPRKLNVEGEEQGKVVYRLIDAQQYEGQNVLVVGGGDSAVEAALALSEVKGVRVALSYRGNAFARIKPANRQRINEAFENRKVHALLETSVVNIESDHVVIEKNDQQVTIPNDAVIVCAGGVLPSAFLQSIGIHVETKYGTA